MRIRKPPIGDHTMPTTPASTSAARVRSGRQTGRLAVAVGALGVVYGDIGTSPIYGVVSLLFWSVMIIVTLTYVTLVMRADNDGEGGIMALIALLRRMGARSG